jgi:hypothetical protein
MRTQKELVKDAIDTLNLIIKKMSDASIKWQVGLDLLSSDPEKEDDKLVDLVIRMKLGSELVKTYITDFSNDTNTLERVVNGTAFLFRGGN